jgi:hypothetical protein
MEKYDWCRDHVYIGEHDEARRVAHEVVGHGVPATGAFLGRNILYYYLILSPTTHLPAHLSCRLSGTQTQGCLSQTRVEDLGVLVAFRLRTVLSFGLTSLSTLEHLEIRKSGAHLLEPVANARVARTFTPVRFCEEPGPV